MERRKMIQGVAVTVIGSLMPGVAAKALTKPERDAQIDQVGRREHQRIDGPVEVHGHNVVFTNCEIHGPVIINGEYATVIGNRVLTPKGAIGIVVNREDGGSHQKWQVDNNHVIIEPGIVSAEDLKRRAN